MDFLALAGLWIGISLMVVGFSMARTFLPTR